MKVCGQCLFTLYTIHTVAFLKFCVLYSCTDISCSVWFLDVPFFENKSKLPAFAPKTCRGQPFGSGPLGALLFKMKWLVLRLGGVNTSMQIQKIVALETVPRKKDKMTCEVPKVMRSSGFLSKNFFHLFSLNFFYVYFPCLSYDPLVLRSLLALAAALKTSTVQRHGPVAKIVAMLKGMAENSEAEGTAEQETFDKFQCDATTLGAKSWFAEKAGKTEFSR